MIRLGYRVNGRTAAGCLFAIVSVLLGTASFAQDFGAAYGGRAGGSVLVPWFLTGPAADVNTLIAIVHDNSILPRRDEFLRVTLFDRDSNPVCSSCVPLSANDVYVSDAFTLVAACDTGKAALDAGIGTATDTVYFGYAAFSPSFDSGCSVIDETGDLVPYVYQVQLATGLVSGLDGPVFEHKGAIVGPDTCGPPRGTGVCRPDFDQYALPAIDPTTMKPQGLFFRILVGLGGTGANANAQTLIFVWSDTSGACGSKPDAACLSRSNQIVCDEQEVCTSQASPLFAHEANVIRADDFIPNSFLTSGGFVAMRSEPTTGSALNVLGYADNQATGLGATLNWRAIFPAQRGNFAP